jgi:hypothetical protein
MRARQATSLRPDRPLWKIRVLPAAWQGGTDLAAIWPECICVKALTPLRFGREQQPQDVDWQVITLVEVLG